MSKATSASTDHVFVIGVGNAYASDDGVGPEIVQRLEASYRSTQPRAPSTVEFVTLRQAGTELLDAMDRCDVLILVDAVPKQSD